MMVMILWQYIFYLIEILFLVIVDKIVMVTLLTNYYGKSDFPNSDISYS